MDLNHLGLALIAYLTGGITVYAYLNRNRYIDLLLASIAIFAYGTSMLFIAFGILPSVAVVLLQLAQVVMVAVIIFLAVRLIRVGYGWYKRTFGRR